MKASTLTRWSRELSGKKDGDIGEGNSICPPLNSTSLYYRHQSDLIAREGGVAGDEGKEESSFRLYSFSLRNEIRFKGVGEMQPRQESPPRKAFEYERIVLILVYSSQSETISARSNLSCRLFLSIRNTLESLNWESCRVIKFIIR